LELIKLRPKSKKVKFVILYGNEEVGRTFASTPNKAVVNFLFRTLGPVKYRATIHELRHLYRAVEAAKL
jgi:hypothetical protein